MGWRRLELFGELMNRFGNRLVGCAITIDEVHDVGCLESDHSSGFQDPKALTEDLDSTVVCEMLNTLLRKNIVKTVSWKRQVVVQIHVNAVNPPVAAGRVLNIGIQPVAVAFSCIVGSRGNL